MTLWCIARAPLIIGAVLPLDAGDSWTLSLLTNRAALAVNGASRRNAPTDVTVGPADKSDLWAWTALPDDDVTGTEGIGMYPIPDKTPPTTPTASPRGPLP